MKTKLHSFGTALVVATALFTASTRAPAQIGPAYALSFSGTSNYVSINAQNVPIANSDYTIEAWIRPNSMGNYGIIGWGKYGTTNQVNAFSLRTNGLVNSWWGNDLVVTNTGLAGAWHHVAATYDGIWRKIYLDGVLVGSNSPPANHNVTTRANFSLGLVGTNDYFNGTIDEVRVWNEARIQAQIQTNRFIRLTGTESGLNAYWQLDEGSGTTAADNAGPWNPGTLVNNPLWVRSTVPFAPEAVTSNATRITTASARLNANVHAGNLAANAWFQWGTTPSYGTNTPLISVGPGLPTDPGALAFQVGSVLTNLTPNTTYHFRVVVTNSVGTNYGADMLVTTLSLPTGPGCALTFNGTNSYVVTPDLTAFFPNTNVTIELGFLAHGPGVLVDELGSYPAVGWHDTQIEAVTTATNSAYADVRVRVWPLGYPGLIVGQVQYGTWNHVALSYNQTNTTLVGFLNGVPGSPATVSRQAPQKSGYGLIYGIGMGDSIQNLGSGAYFDGQIDEFRLWNVARTTNDIQANLNRPLAGNEPGLVAYWQFDECSGAEASDTTGHGYDGTLINGPTWTNSTVHYGPWITTLPATNLTTTAAVLKGTVNPQGFATTAWFQWGATTNYGNTTAVTNAGSGTSSVALSTNITGLASFQTYHFRAVASNSYGVSYGADQSFWLGSPLVTTLPATDLTTNAATVNGSVIPSGPSAQAWFQWGLTTNYGSTTTPVPLGPGSVPLAVTNRLQPLLSGYTYHYRTVASNSFGVALGSDLTFTGPVFGEIIVAGPPGVSASSVAWGDYNNDGYLDVLVTGYAVSLGANISRVYRNNGNGTFTDIGAVLPGVQGGAVAWGDYDNDGYLDILLTGLSASGAISKIYHNNGNGTFTDLNAGLPGVYWSSVAWGDYNNDGCLDILLTGTTDGSASGAVSKIYRNNGNGTFTDLNASLPGVEGSSVAWGDYNKDGYLDILLTGASASGNISKIYRNNRNGTFTDLNASLPGVYWSSVAWGDYDNDGNLDFLLTGMTDLTETNIFLADFESGNNGFSYLPDPGATSNLWHRTAHRAASPTHSQYYGLEGTYTYDIGAITAGNLQSPPISLAGFTPPVILSFNYLLLTEGGPSYDRATVAVSTNGGSTWTALLSTTSSTLPLTAAFANRTADLSAYAGKDILVRFNFNTIDVTANNYEGWYVDDVTIRKDVGPISRVYRNNGDGTFTVSADLPGVLYSSAAWGDYDNDGYLDILLTGTTNGATSGATSKIYRNNGNSTFTDLATTSLPGAYNGGTAWGDYDNDGRLDILFTGIDPGGSWVFHLFHNYWLFTNSVPAAPGNLIANVVGTNALLSWSVGSDAQTPATGLSYNLRVGTTPGGWNVVSPEATNTGWRRVPQLGNMQQSLSATLTGLKYGSNYYWSVQAVDTAFAGSPFVSLGSFTVTPAPSAVAVVVGSLMGNSAVIEASVYPNGSPTTAWFQWGTTASYGNRTALVNVGSGMGPVLLRQTLSGLQPGKVYHYRIVTSNANGTTYGADQTFYLDPAVLIGDANGDGVIGQSELDAVLAGYWPTSPWLYMTNTAGLGGTNVTFALTNSTAGAYSVWMSTNLSGWDYLGPATPRYEFTDTNAPAIPQRFYRLQWP